MSRTGLCIFALFVLTSCGSGDDPRPAPAPVAPPTAPAPDEAPTVEPAVEPAVEPTEAAPTDPGPAPRPAPLTPAQRRELRDAIREGRQAAHGGRFADALAAFERAVAITPASGRLRCEAAYVAFQGGDLDRADVHLGLALAALPRDEQLRDELRRPTAMCLYNAGLIHESHDRLPAALDAFRRSLALRPNDTVRGRLEALEARVGPTPSDEEAPSSVLGPFAAETSFEDVAARVRETLCARGGGGFGPGELESCDAIDVEIRRAGASPLEGAVLAYEVIVDAGGAQLWTVLAIRGAGQLRVARLAEGYSPGAMGMSVDPDARIEVRDVLPGGSPELVVTSTAEAGDSDMGTCDYWGFTEASTIVCSVDDGTLRCAAIPVTSVSVNQHEAPCDSAYGDDADDEPVDEREGYELLLRFEDGRAILTRDPAGRSTDAPPVIGAHPLPALLGREDLAWPDAWTTVDLVSG